MANWIELFYDENVNAHTKAWLISFKVSPVAPDAQCEVGRILAQGWYSKSEDFPGGSRDTDHWFSLILNSLIFSPRYDVCRSN